MLCTHLYCVDGGDRHRLASLNYGSLFIDPSGRTARVLCFLRIQHTSTQHIGQMFVPAMNQALPIGTIGLVLLFGASSHLAAAYGIAVSITMMITTLLVYRVARYVWHWNILVTTCVMAVFLCVDVAFFNANILKIPHRGWVPLALGLAIVMLMTWHRGRAIVSGHLQASAPTLAEFLKSTMPRLAECRAMRVFLVQHPGATPLALAQNVRHNKVLHEHLFFLTVVTEAVPHLERDDVFPKPSHVSRDAEAGHGALAREDIRVFEPQLAAGQFVFSSSLRTGRRNRSGAGNLTKRCRHRLRHA
jgi:K+ transporter